MPDTFEAIWREVRLYNPKVPAELCQHWVRDRFRDIVDKRLWSWAIAESQFVTPASYNIGTVSLTLGSPNVTGSGTTFTSAMVGRQLKVANFVFTIIDVQSATILVLDRDWGKPSVSGQTYIIAKTYFTVPADFRYFYSVIDPANNWKLWTNFSARELNNWDPARTSTGNPVMLASLRYDTESGLPMYEMWPFVVTERAFPFLYWKINPDFDTGVDLPHMIRGDVIKRGALADLCKWPGTDEFPNRMFNLNLCKIYEEEFQTRVMELERNDQEIYLTDLWYEKEDLPYAPLDARFYQTHAV